MSATEQAPQAASPITQYHRTTNPYEAQFKYSRAVKKGPFIFVSGTTSLCPKTQTILHPTSAYLQAQTIFAEIASAIEALGGNPKTDVVRVRMYVTHDEDGGDVGKALKESGFGAGEDGKEGGPAATMILGVKFVDQDMKVEIEADAVVL
ncbi:YjgF-like protein [Coprinellus micaceus]|jgi:enamine deaminase RidA (YjgF/YER057c/UK114 family)|uniref:YjgF-like protein n=1 Tax=Coprinellus micaceus TaxID=71717 RepID=A0A4Y7SQT7_COPMI|nr:YjgF-like protein [Coprinellus micaceus]